MCRGLLSLLVDLLLQRLLLQRLLLRRLLWRVVLLCGLLIRRWLHKRRVRCRMGNGLWRVLDLRLLLRRR